MRGLSLAAFALLLGACAERTPTFSEGQVLGGERVEAETLEHGLGLYRRHCATCHGAAGAGDGPRATGLDPRPADLRTGRFEHAASAGALPSRAAIARVLREGVPGTAMGPQQLRPEDLEAIAAYVMTFSPAFAESRSEPNNASDRP